MTDSFPNVSRPDETGTPQTNQGGKADAAREQASDVKDHAVDAAGHVAQTSKERASDVVGEAKSQAQDLLAQTREELRDQAGHQQRRVAEGLRSVSDEFSEMARNSESGGMATELVQNAARRTGSIAGWLDDRDPGSLLDEVRRFASRKPGTFIAVAAAAGLLAGRLTRSIASGASEESGRSATTGTNTSTTNTGAGTAYGSSDPYPDAVTGPPVAVDTEAVGAPTTPLYSSLAGEETAGDGYVRDEHLGDEYVEGASAPERITPLVEGTSLDEGVAARVERPYGEER